MAGTRQNLNVVRFCEENAGKYIVEREIECYLAEVHLYSILV